MRPSIARQQEACKELVDAGVEIHRTPDDILKNLEPSCGLLTMFFFPPIALWLPELLFGS